MCVGRRTRETAIGIIVILLFILTITIATTATAPLTRDLRAPRDSARDGHPDYCHQFYDHSYVSYHYHSYHYPDRYCLSTSALGARAH